jgi:IS605 OrfB family transposase
MSFRVDKWEKEALPIAKLRTLKIRIYPTMEQKKILDKFIDTSRFVYNRTLEFIKKGHKPNFQDLRDLLVTENTKKGLVEYKEYDQIISDLREKQKNEENKAEIKRIVEKIKQVQQERRNKMKEYDYIKNPLVNSFETGTPKDIRSNAVKRCCDAMKSGFSNLKNGNIKFFNMKFKKKTEPIQTIELTPKIISIHNGNIKIAPETFLGNCYLKIDKHNNRKLKHLEIVNNVDITRFKRRYYLQLSIKTNPISCDKCDNIAGVDPGVRTFATVHSNNISSNEIEITEYKHRSDVLKKLNNKIKSMNKLRRRIRKKQYNKIEKRKKDLVDKLHWDFIHHLLSHNDVIYFGDIKSHDIVKGGKNKTLNLNFNDLKFFQLKQRLLYKASMYGKKVFYVPEHYTTKTCSCCGMINNNVGSKEVFTCPYCNLITGRDMNASKNMKMKGLFN